jgi:trimeric autotransporter adhesin
MFRIQRFAFLGLISLVAAAVFVALPADQAAAVECSPIGAAGGGSNDNNVTSDTTCGDGATTQNTANPTATFEQASAYGSDATAIADQATAIGSTAIAEGVGATAIGFGSQSQGLNTIAIGDATVSGANGIAIGDTASVTSSATAGVAIGLNALASQANAVSLGPVARSLSARTTIVGTDVSVGTSSDSSSVFGDSASVGDGASNGLALGASATVGSGHTNAAAFGAGASTTRANQQVFGTSTNTYTMSGITSAASTNAQVGGVQGVVTTDANGNLASDGGALQTQANTNNTNIAGNTAAIGTNTTSIAKNSQAIGVNTTNIANNSSRIGALEDTAFGMQQGIDRNARNIRENAEGVAMAMAMDAPDLQATEKMALKMNWGTFAGESGFAFSGAMRLSQHVSLDGGVGMGASGDNMGGRAGLRVGW